MPAEPCKFAVPRRGSWRFKFSIWSMYTPVPEGLPFLTFPPALGTRLTTLRGSKTYGLFFFFRLLGGSWGDLGAILGALGPILGALGPILGALGPILGALGPILSALGSILGVFGLISNDFLVYFRVRK